jgi:chemotaxis protein MotB
VDLKMDKAALEQQAREKAEEYDAVTQGLQQEVDSGQMRITRYKDMLTLDVADEILFDSADARLKKGGDAILRLVGKALLKGDKTIRVVGHTDDQPMAKGAAFATNWELSTARATTVVRFLQEECGLDPKRLLASGRGQWMPVASNATADGRHRNRRIQIMLLDKDLLNGAEGQQP